MLYLVRHAHALDGDEDFSRPLSERGRAQVVALARFLRGRGAFQPREVWHSPLRRAQETAQLLVEQLDLRAARTEMPDLRPEDEPAAVARRLKLVRHPLAIVGHEPHLSALASLLVLGTTQRPAFVMKKCGVLALEPAGPLWLVHWQLTPELLG
jgi:phosphohistidine phosphatase